MRQTLSQQNITSLEEFIAWYPEASQSRYELHQGIIVEMPKPKGKHSQIAGFLMNELAFEIRRLNLPYFVPRECLVQSEENSAYEPDAIVLDRNFLDREPFWEKESRVIQGRSIPLIIEVVSTNWSDDYALKFDAYETLGIQEYWIVDYLGLGGRKFIGSPKRPTLTIYHLEHGVEHGEYQGNQFREDCPIASCIFPELQLTARQVFMA